MRRLTLIFALGVIATPAMAQRGFPAPHFSFNRGFGASPGFGRGGAYLSPFAVPADAYYGDALVAGYPVVPQPPVVVLQHPAGYTATEPRVTGEPVLIELQGDHYVRLSGPVTSSAIMLDVQPSAREDAGPTRTPQTQLAQHKPATQPELVSLVFRDGHREDVSDYVIANGILYAHTSYYADGAWTKNIDIAALNVPETVSYNESRGVRFLVPNAGYEVIVGP
jgi:hypothetical protein